MSQKQQSTQHEHAITITYFNHSMAQGEKVRLCCLLGGIPFNDNRIRNSEWKDLKGITPHGVLPLLLEDGKEVKGQSTAILRYLGRRCGLYPNDPELAYQVDMLLGLATDFDRSWRVPLYMGIRPENFYYESGSADTDFGQMRTKRAREQWLKNDLPRFMNLYSSYLRRNGGKYFLGNTLTIVDCHILPQLRSFQRGHVDYIPTTCLDQFPDIVSYINNMLSLPVLRDWYGLGEPQKTFTVSELAMYRGLNGGPVYLGAKGIVFDVSGSTFYAPGNNYHIFTGYDASRALAKMSLDVKDLENPSIDDLNESELQTLDDWVEKFKSKYTIVGRIGYGGGVGGHK